MPAKSKKQQQFMGMVHAIQKGELDPSEVSPEMRKVAKDMKKKDVEDFAKTKHKGLPKKVKKEETGMKLKDALQYESTIFNDNSKGLTEEEKSEFLETIGNFNQFNESVYREQDLKELSQNITKLAELAETYIMNEQDDWFDSVSIKRDMKSIKESAKLFEKTCKEMSVLQQRLESVYESIGGSFNKYFEIGQKTISEDQLDEGKMKELMMMIDDEFEITNDPKQVAKNVAKELKLKPNDIMDFVKDRYKDLKKQGKI